MLGELFRAESVILWDTKKNTLFIGIYLIPFIFLFTHQVFTSIFVYFVLVVISVHLKLFV